MITVELQQWYEQSIIGSINYWTWCFSCKDLLTCFMLRYECTWSMDVFHSHGRCTKHLEHLPFNRWNGPCMYVPTPQLLSWWPMAPSTKTSQIGTMFRVGFPWPHLLIKMSQIGAMIQVGCPWPHLLTLQIIELVTGRNSENIYFNVGHCIFTK